jgi:3-hydroxyacyl-CoA dehydrogenase
LLPKASRLPFDAAAPLIEKMLNEFKRPGKKEGKGFYEYPELWQEANLAGSLRCLCEG